MRKVARRRISCVDDDLLPSGRKVVPTEDDQLEILHLDDNSATSKAPVVVDTNGDGTNASAAIGTTGDGQVDSIVKAKAIDTTGDGKVDSLGIDTNYDGVIDSVVSQTEPITPTVLASHNHTLLETLADMEDELAEGDHLFGDVSSALSSSAGNTTAGDLVGVHQQAARKDVAIAVGLLATYCAVGILFYHFVEGWSVVDVVYFSICTITTVGYGDLTASTDGSKIFTIFYQFIGFALAGAALGLICSLVLEWHARYSKRLGY